MGKISEFLTGIKVLQTENSPINGDVAVVKSIAFGTYLQVGGLTQSGGIIKTIWSKSLRKVQIVKKNVGNVLVLGLGGGSIIQVLQKNWPAAKITGVDIDPVMVKLGQKHLGFHGEGTKVVISDASQFVRSKSKSDVKFDLVCIDLYLGDEFPKKFESTDFILSVKKILNKSGIVVINRLYYGKKRAESLKFGEFLEKFFSKVEVVYPEANVMYICSKAA